MDQPEGLTCIIPSYHMIRRIRDRVRLNRKGITKFLDKAYTEGIRISDIRKASRLYYYLKNNTREGYYTIIYNGYILVVSVGGIGVTILRLPREFIKIVIKIKNKKILKETDQ